MVGVTLKPCGYSRNPGPHELKVLPCNLSESFVEHTNINRNKAHQVVCSCTMSGPIGSSYDDAVRKHNEGLP